MVTLANGAVQDYGYDAASRITSIAYRSGATAVGDLGYGYDALGRATSTFGTLASVQLPAVTLTGSSAPVYNANNQLMKWNGTAIPYDANGNMLGDGSKTYVWNARDQLTQVKSGTTVVGSFSYDGLGRQTQKKARMMEAPHPGCPGPRRPSRASQSVSGDLRKVELPLEAVSPWTFAGGLATGCALGVWEGEVTSGGR